MTNTFSIEAFAAGCTQAMVAADNGREAARLYLEDAINRHGPEEIIRALQAAVPSGADIGEMIVHASPKLTMLYARVPGRLQSGIHNHTVCAVLGQLRGQEINRIYELDRDGALREARTVIVRAGEILVLGKDVIHCIENPDHEPAHALHLYAGDFRAITDRRSLWSWDDHEEKPFSFPELLKESVAVMHQSGNRTGLDALVQAIPSSQALVDSLGK